MRWGTVPGASRGDRESAVSESGATGSNYSVETEMS